jgi:holin-like protein
MLGLAILLFFNLLGVVAHDYLFVPLPGNVLGLLLLLLALALKIVRLHWVEDAAGFLLKHMMLLFAPVIVGILALTNLVAANWLPLVATVVLSTMMTLLATAGVASLLSQSDHDHPDPSVKGDNPR